MASPDVHHLCELHSQHLTAARMLDIACSIEDLIPAHVRACHACAEPAWLLFSAKAGWHSFCIPAPLINLISAPAQDASEVAYCSMRST